MAAVGMYMSVVVSVFFGWILLLAVTFAVPSTDFAIEQINAGAAVVPVDVGRSMGQTWGEMLFVCVVAQFFCVTASTTSASRMMFAFSRDGASLGTRHGGSRSTVFRSGRVRCSASQRWPAC